MTSPTLDGGPSSRGSARSLGERERTGGGSGLRDTGPVNAFDTAGRLLWRTEAKAHITALSPSFALASLEEARGTRVVTLDRATGAVRHELGVLIDYGGLALVSDAAYVYLWLLTFDPTPSPRSLGMDAITPAGVELRKLLPDYLGGDVFEIAPVPGRVFVLGRSGTITCLTDSDSEVCPLEFPQEGNPRRHR
jgi:hypothetical protein